MHISFGLGDPLKQSLRLELALKGLRRRRPRANDTRLPITAYILRVIKTSLSAKPYDFDCIMLWAACCLGFFAFLRSGELTVPSAAGFDPKWHLTPMDIAVDNQSSPIAVQITLKGSKTDQTRKKIQLYIGRSHNDICPVAALLTYLSVRGIDTGPLFRLENGQPLTRQNLVSLIKSALQSQGVDPTHYSGHSFRIGAATTAAACGIGDATIQTLGCWKSDSYVRYIRIPRQELAQLASRLAE